MSYEKRKRSAYAICIFTVILLGLVSRSGSPLIPDLIKEYAGDTLWALAVYLTIAFVFPQSSIKQVTVIAAMISFTVEISQLYHSPWIDQIRQSRLGGLLLGLGFLWSDLVCYVLGISIGILLESRNERKFMKTEAKMSKESECE